MIKVPEELLAFAEALADCARAAVLPHFRAGVAAEYKDDASPVTVADRECERALREMISREYPAHAILGEEFGASGGDDAEWTWVLDPIDGTLSFTTGSPLFCALIGLAYKGAPAAGVLDMPALNERWRGSAAGGAFLNDKPCAPSAQTDIGQALMTTTTVAPASCAADSAALLRLAKSCAQLRLGGDGFNFGCVAAGFADIAADVRMKAHDFCALAPIVIGAGGVMTDWENRPLHINSGDKVVAAATPALHRAALAALR